MRDPLSAATACTAPTPTVDLREGKLQGRKMARKWYITDECLKDYFEQPEEQARLQEG